MRNFVLILILILGFVLGSTLGPSIFVDKGEEDKKITKQSDQREKVKWKLASAFSSQTPIIGTVMVRTLNKIRVSSNSAFDIVYYEPGALVPALEIFDAVSSGSVDAGYATPGFWAGKISSLQLFGSVPFGPAASEYLAWVYYGGGREMMDEIYSRHNIKSIPCMLMPPESSGWFREEINSIEELKGLKMRFYALGARVMEKLGVSTQLLASGDIFPALELGTIDATEFSSPAVDIDLGFHQIAKHNYFPGWHQQSTWGDIMINLDKWNALSKENKALLEMACGDSVRDSLAEGEASQFPALEKLSEKGVKFHKWDESFLNSFKNAWLEVVEEESQKDDDFKRVFEHLSDFRSRYKAWSDLGYLN